MLIYLLVILVSMIGGIILDRYICNRAFYSIRQEYNKYVSFFSILEQWLSNNQNNIRLETYLMGQGYRKVAIYGMSVLGNLLYQELKDTEVKVQYAIDRSSADMYFELPVLNPTDEYDEVDAIIVTAILDFEKIKSNIEKRTQADVISLENVVYETAEM